MILDLATGEVSGQIAADICIIGGGVAGQILAEALSSPARDVVIVESGGRDFDPAVQSLAHGQNIGMPYYDLDDSRLRLFGGTAAIWGGRCAELDAIDFEKRDYLPHSGWPVTKTDLTSYYKQVFDRLGLKQPSAEDLWTTIKKSAPPFDADKLDSDLWVFDEQGERFTDPSRKSFDHTRILLNATVTDIDVNAQNAVQHVKAESVTGHCTKITAKAFVLAAGAIETVRLLMAAVGNRPNGLGNEHDLLGRYFMEHPHARGGEFLPNKLAQTLLALPRAIRRDGNRYAAYLRPADKLQRDKGILNSSISIAPRLREGERMELFRAVTGKLKHDLPSSRFWRASYHGLKKLAVKGLEWTDPWSSILNMKLNRNRLGVFAIVRAEQAPNPDSRIILGCATDRLGMRQVELDWQLSEIDKRSVKVLMETVGEEYRRLGWGDVVLSDWLSETSARWKTDPLISSHPIGGYHHMGGTRMSSAPDTGVVDKNCKLHDSPNLFVASSSVFPTGGWANPTVTIMALALRLADHLESIFLERPVQRSASRESQGRVGTGKPV
ncbi:GMC family oxidoreductase [Parasphingorhabdus litoris]|uniref:GMC family oxidoreductase n=1 Tax=Parasphingorhabdus litoris TaxID=394733 RepID=A0ABN1AJQ7_9SPHN|nr:GMC family oxidoreductase [Parasphingorhabdus litoris]